MIVWNEPYYGIDCFDVDVGLPKLVQLIESGEMEKIDLCLTDPPYNINATSKENFRHPKKELLRNDIIEEYNDTIDKYKEFSENWFNLAKRICNRLVFTCGKDNLAMWYSICPKFKQGIWLIKNSCSRGYISHFLKYEPILFWGSFKERKLKKDYVEIRISEIDKIEIIEAIAESGFIVHRGNRKSNFKHPHPKPRKLYFEILSNLQPISVLDPFFGSGVSGEVCMRLNIPFISYEIVNKYQKDWNYRYYNVKSEGRGIF